MCRAGNVLTQKPLFVEKHTCTSAVNLVLRVNCLFLVSSLIALGFLDNRHFHVQFIIAKVCVFPYLYTKMKNYLSSHVSGIVSRGMPSIAL